MRGNKPKPINHVFTEHVEPADGPEMIVRGTLEFGDGVFAGIKLELVGVDPADAENTEERIVPRAERFELPKEPQPFDPCDFD